MHKTMTLVGSLGVGAGLIYLAEPARGGRRRALIRDRAVRGFHNVRDFFGKAGHEIGTRARGVLARNRSEISDRSSLDETTAALRDTSRPAAEASDSLQRNRTPGLGLAAGIVGLAATAYVARAMVVRHGNGTSQVPSIKSPLWASLQKGSSKGDGLRPAAAQAQTPTRPAGTRPAWW